AQGDPPGGGDPAESDPSGEVDIPSDQNPSLAMVKSASPTTVTAAGQVVTYTFRVTNTGNVTEHGIDIDEGTFTGSGTLSPVTCPAEAGSLAPGDSVDCTATYEVTQTDIDRGETIHNVATATGTSPAGDDESPPGSADVTEVHEPGLTLVKSASPDTAQNVGDVITFSFLVTNTGNVTLTDVSVTDVQAAPAGPLDGPIDCQQPLVVLTPGGQVTCTATYTLTQADVDAGGVGDTAVAHGTPPGTDVPVDSPPSQVVVDVPPSAGLSVAKTSDATSFVVGQKITYSFRVTNTGNVTLDNIVVHDSSFSGTGTLSPVSCPKTSLAAGESETCTATYIATQDDVNAGRLTNSATVEGTPPGGSPDDVPTTSDPSDVDTPAEQHPALMVIKTADAKTFVLGQKITYTFTVTSTGNVTLTDVTPVEGSFSGSGKLSPLACPTNRTLTPGKHLTCTATYTATAADVKAGKLENLASASGKVPGQPGANVPKPNTNTSKSVLTVGGQAQINTGGGAMINTGLGGNAPAGGNTTAVMLGAIGLMLAGAFGLLITRRRSARQ
ncbi:MAG: hypothetical protein FWD74_10390, partial [Actinomycetia bacterium]|nr:hypothetical protein [Actinomycetes bacterium]